MLIDTHAHLDQEEFDADRGAAIARARGAGVEAILCPAVSAASSGAVVRWAEEFHLAAAVGIHPNSTREAGPDDWASVVKLLDHPRVVALGETGLDRYWEHSPPALQEDYFRRHLRAAEERGLPVIVHCRDAQEEVLAMLREAADRAQRPICGVIHAFRGDAAFAAECLALGLHLGFAGNVTYPNKKFEPLRETARSVPLDRILVETDSPYLIPQLFRGKDRRNEPANVVHTTAFLAELRGESFDAFAAATTANAHRLFRLPGSNQ